MNPQEHTWNALKLLEISSRTSLKVIAIPWNAFETSRNTPETGETLLKSPWNVAETPWNTLEAQGMSLKSPYMSLKAHVNHVNALWNALDPLKHLESPGTPLSLCSAAVAPWNAQEHLWPVKILLKSCWNPLKHPWCFWIEPFWKVFDPSETEIPWNTTGTLCNPLEHLWNSLKTPEIPLNGP